MHGNRTWRIVKSSVLCLALVGCGGVSETAPLEPQETSPEALKAKEEGMKKSAEMAKEFAKKNRKK